MRQLFQLALFLGIAAGPILAESASAHRATYSKNLRIHVGVLGAKDGKPLTEGPDFKPVWSKTGGRILFFRRVVNHREVGKWKTAVHIINTDGTGLKQLTSGKFTDINHTWTRDGPNTPIWNRKKATGDANGRSMYVERPGRAPFGFAAGTGHRQQPHRPYPSRVQWPLCHRPRLFQEVTS